MAIGQRIPMVDSVERVTGRIPYALNVELPGLLVGQILPSTYPHARVRRVDTRKAAAAPGVVAVVSGDDLRDARLDPYYGPLVRDQPILALDRVRYVGEAVAADAAGLPLERVSVSEPDTDSTPYDQQTSSSRTTYSMGTAIRLAADDVRRQLAELAAAELEVAAGDVVLADGNATVRGAPERSMPYGDLVRKARRGNLLGNGTFVSRAKPDPVTGEPGVSAHWHHAVGAAEVEVDTETGRVEVLRFHAGVFVGRIINPVQCELQAEGSVAFGLGQARLEEMAFDDGRLTNPNLSDYMLPSFKDLPPELSVNVLEEPGSNEIHGIGETALPPVIAAVTNAVADAIGVQIRKLPLTPERVLRAIREQDGR